MPWNMGSIRVKFTFREKSRATLSFVRIRHQASLVHFKQVSITVLCITLWSFIFKVSSCNHLLLVCRVQRFINVVLLSVFLYAPDRRGRVQNGLTQSDCLLQLFQRSKGRRSWLWCCRKHRLNTCREVSDSGRSLPSASLFNGIKNLN